MAVQVDPTEQVDNTELTEQGAELKATLQMIEADPKILDTDPALKKWYEEFIVPNIKTPEEIAAGDNPGSKILGDAGGSVKLEEVMRTRFGVNNIDELETEVTELRAETLKANNIAARLNKMSVEAPELHNAITSYLDGGDYKKNLTRAGSDVNFEKPLSEQSVPELLTHYFGDVYTKDEIKDYKNSDNAALLKAVSIAKESFENDRRVILSNKNNFLLQQQTKEQENQIALKNSVAELKKAYPNASNAQIEKLTTAFIQGAVNNFFFDRNGKVSPDAMKIMYALYYPSLVNKEAAKPTIEKKNEAMMDFLSRGKGNERVFNRGSMASPGSTEDAKNAMKLLSSLGIGRQKEWGANTKEKK